MADQKRLVLLDIDGTLLKAGGAGREAKSRAMLDVFGTDGGVMTHPFGGKTDWRILSEVLEESGITVDEIGRRMPEYQQIMARYMESLIDQFPVMALPGAMALVHTLRERSDIVLGIVSGNTQSTAPVKLRAAGFDPDWFPVGAFGSESVDRNDLSRMALDRANQLNGGGIAASEVLVVGDTPDDVRCARAIGAVAVGVLTGFAPAEEMLASGPDYLLDDLTTFFDVVPL